MSKVYSVSYALGIGGLLFTDDMIADVESITYVETVADEADTLTIVLNDRNLRYIDGAYFTDDTPVNFRGGWDDNAVLNFEGFISIIDVDFPEEGCPVLTLTCLDNSRKLNSEKKRRTWENVRLSDVIRILAQEHGLYADVDEIGLIKPVISQGDVSDIQFIIDSVRAESEEYYVKVTLNTLSVKKENVLQPPVYELWYRQHPYDIFSFSPRVSKEDKPAQVTKADINSTTGNIETGVADTDTQRPLQGDQIIPDGISTWGWTGDTVGYSDVVEELNTPLIERLLKR